MAQKLFTLEISFRWNMSVYASMISLNRYVALSHIEDSNINIIS